MTDHNLRAKIKSLLLKGFNKEEIKVLLDLKDDKIINKCLKQNSSNNISSNSVEFYSELQKDLSKVVLNEMSNKEKKDSGVILNAIKLQAELQEKKIFLSKGAIPISVANKNKNNLKISRDYIYERDQRIAQAKNEGIPNAEIAKMFNISEMSLTWAKDRVELNLPEHLKQLNPTIVCETMGLKREERLDILEKALELGLTKSQVRNIVNERKNLNRKNEYEI